MSYFDPYLDNNTFSVFNVPSNRPVSIYYNGSGLHSIAGPVPFMNLNFQPNKTEAGTLNSKRIGINVTGKIVRNGVDTGVTPAGTGIQSIIGAIDLFSDLFIDNGYNGVFEVKCGDTTIFSATGVRANSFNAERSNDNWVFTADYTIELEYYEAAKDDNGNQYFIKNSSDSWSIEPLEEYIYTSFNIPITQKSEINNPNLKPQAATLANPVPSLEVGGSQFSSNPLLQVMNIPQYRITRKLSAVGIPVGTGMDITMSAYQEAKRWVSDRLNSSFNSSASGLGHFLNTGDQTLSSGPTHLYNHLRTTNFSVTEGSFELNETWLAMPTGIKYVEDYTIESSTGPNFQKSIRVQGEIRGLSAVPFSVMGGQSGLIPDSNGLIDLNVGYARDSGNLTTSLMDVNSRSAVSTFAANKYENANSGWIYDIKPYLYRRACIAVNSVDRTSVNLNPAQLVQNLNNPSYAKETLLNIIPINSSETHIPRRGSISYNFEFSNKMRFISGVLDETITVNDTGPTDIINEAFVLGRRLGPVLQNLGSKTSSRKEISINVVVPPPSSIGGLFLTNTECPMYTGGLVYSSIETIIEGLKPFGDRHVDIFGNFDKRTKSNITNTNNEGQVYKSTDTHSWNPTEGTFSRQVAWVYQQCNNNRIYLDN